MLAVVSGADTGAEKQRYTSPPGFYLAHEFPRPPERLGALSWHLSRVCVAEAA